MILFLRTFGIVLLLAAAFCCLAYDAARLDESMRAARARGEEWQGGSSMRGFTLGMTCLVLAGVLFG